MEQLNRVELRGIVGSVRESKVSNIIVVRLTVATNYAYRAQDGTAVIETTWHEVEKFYAESPGIQKGDKVEVVGRLKTQRFLRDDGQEVSRYYVVAKSIEKLEIEESLKMEV